MYKRISVCLNGLRVQDERRRAAHEAGVSGVEALRAELQLPAEGAPAAPTQEQELQLLRYRLNQVKDICAAFKPAPLPKKVLAAAVTFMLRFYLRRSCLLHDLQLFTVSCIYIAAKVTERYVDAGRLESMLKVKASDILACETEVLDALEFDLVVYSPYRSIDSLVEELKSAAKSGAEAAIVKLAAAEHWLANVHKLAYSFQDALMRSDAPLCMAPGQQALGAIAHALTTYGMPADAVAARYARLAQAVAADAAPPQDLQDHIQSIIKKASDLATAGFKSCSKEVAAALDKAVRQFNPAVEKNSKLAKQLRSIQKKRKREEAEEDDD